MHQKDEFMICRFHFETDKIERCNMNDVTIPHALCIKERQCVLRHMSQKGYYDYRKLQMGSWDHTL